MPNSLQAFDILRQLYESRAFICRAVLQEIQAGIDSGWKYPWLRGRTGLQVINQALDEGWLQIPRSEVNPGDDIVELQLALEYGQRFGAGEAEAMAIA
ncbi:MAG: hypothetical protein RIG63_04675 [Coleofasciculus chthonoplastes F3-SA18-01]|uniref:hypothetical protein n=1 Tax=Coleofasciculus chthonoplastes TaxID=64178 RepID=UPI0033022071